MFACICVHRNQAEQNKLSTMEERRNVGTFFFSCVQEKTELFCCLIAASAAQKTDTLWIRMLLSRNWVLLTDSC